MDSLDTDFLRDAMEQVRMIQCRLLTAQTRQKSYIDRRVRVLVFTEGAHVWLRVSPLKDESHVLSLESVELGLDLTFEQEPIAILDRQFQKHRNEEVASKKVQ
ncbi:uncharacterized protein [Solanum lycopersicum]|uniref:uncharacterized protein n=1 Tax=Solanum lycopersicum TaxID=4081 RepID=UPI0037478B09